MTTLIRFFVVLLWIIGLLVAGAVMLLMYLFSLPSKS